MTFFFKLQQLDGLGVLEINHHELARFETMIKLHTVSYRVIIIITDRIGKVEHRG
jgi:hypothetical protein